MIIERLEHPFCWEVSGDSGPLLWASTIALLSCSGPGDKTAEVTKHAPLQMWKADRDEMVAVCREYGTWDDLDTVEASTLKERVLWLAASDWREENN